MARGARIRPERLPEKLLQIRIALGLSQSELLRRLGFEDAMDYRRISEFERGTTEPHLSVLWNMRARLAFTWKILSMMNWTCRSGCQAR
jgi:transcriptional regulator with XRE-family HTH domain